MFDDIYEIIKFRHDKDLSNSIGNFVYPFF